MDLWPPFRGFLMTHIQTHGRTPLDEWSARRRGLYLHRTTQHINTNDKHPCSERDSNARSQQPSGHRPRGHWDRRSPNSLHKYCTKTLDHPVYMPTLCRLKILETDYEDRSTHQVQQDWWCFFSWYNVVSSLLAHSLIYALHFSLCSPKADYDSLIIYRDSPNNFLLRITQSKTVSPTIIIYITISRHDMFRL
jgi:hypothetical protein